MLLLSRNGTLLLVLGIEPPCEHGTEGAQRGDHTAGLYRKGHGHGNAAGVVIVWENFLKNYLGLEF